MGDEGCNMGLGLGLGVGEYMPKRDHPKNKNKGILCLDLSFALNAKEEEQVMDVDNKTDSSTKTIEEDKNGNCKSTCYRNSSNDENKNFSSRKKLRLTKQQSTLLEDSFKQHNTLNTAQKQALAEKLDLRPRQVEVWFQNRRARTKLKQTEVDRELLKKCCEGLSDENRRLKRELQELRVLMIEDTPPPLFIQFPKTPTSLEMCPSCEDVVKAAATTTTTTDANNTSAAVPAAASAIDVNPQACFEG